jgi:hypothetical protein
LETRTSTSKKDILTARKDNKVSSHGRSANSVIQKNAIIRRYFENVPENFSAYLNKLSIGNDRNLMVLSTNHYYYEAADLKWVKILVNVKQLNEIREIRDFIFSISSVLPVKSYFIGCFFDNKTRNYFDPTEHGILSRNPFLNVVYSLIDFRTHRYLTKTTVNSHFEQAALKIQDITEIEELTYFCAQKVLQEN